MGNREQEHWRVVESRFEMSAPEEAQAPADSLPEIAVAGRSNVGKSSLLNAFSGRTGLARVSRTPGRTRLLNMFNIRMLGPDRQSLSFRWVDLPGYGFAAAAKDIRKGFGPMVEGYLQRRAALRGMVLLVDVRRELRDGEFGMLHLMTARELPTLICVTKCDKLGAAKRGTVARKLANTLDVDPRDILMTSSLSGEGLGDAPGRGGLARDLSEMVRVDEQSTVVDG